jgi:hypothetical protein
VDLQVIERYRSFAAIEPKVVGRSVTRITLRAANRVDALYSGRDATLPARD